MSLTILTDMAEIEVALGELKKCLDRKTERYKDTAIGWQGGNLCWDVNWHPALEFWHMIIRAPDVKRVIQSSSQPRSNKSPRHLVWFGTEHPEDWNSLPCSVEINIPTKGLNGRVAGCFARSGDGSIWIAHSGKIGGGKKGVGKQAFLDSLGPDEKIVDVNKGDGKYRQLILIGKVGSRNLPKHLNAFVRLVDSFKQSIAAGTHTQHAKPSTDTFKPEFFGKAQPYIRTGITEANCDHGLVHQELVNLCKKHGCTPYTDQRRDLYTAKEQGRPSLLFEIKTSDQWQYIYTAVGQLLIHKSKMHPSTRCILVAPNSKQNGWVSTVKKLGVEAITYTMRDGTPSFDRNATSVFKQ